MRPANANVAKRRRCACRFSMRIWTRSAAITRTPRNCQKLIPSPNHGDASRETAADVEGQIFFRACDLTSAALFRQLLERFVDLPDTRRANRMTVANQAAANIHRNFPANFPSDVFAAHLRQ